MFTTQTFNDNYRSTWTISHCHCEKREQVNVLWQVLVFGRSGWTLLSLLNVIEGAVNLLVLNHENLGLLSRDWNHQDHPKSTLYASGHCASPSSCQRPSLHICWPCQFHVQERPTQTQWLHGAIHAEIVTPDDYYAGIPNEIMPSISPNNLFAFSLFATCNISRGIMGREYGIGHTCTSWPETMKTPINALYAIKIRCMI